MTGRWLAVCPLLATVIIACGGGDSTHSVIGVMIDVKATSLTQVDTFTLQDVHGNIHVFHIAPEAARDPQEGFVASHLRTHALAVDRVRITYRMQNGEVLAFKLEHCSAASPPC